MVITAIANQKGGVAKTTSTIAIGGLLAESTNCLVIDLDPQGNLTTGLGIQLSKGQITAYEVLMGQATLQDAVIQTPYNLSLLPNVQIVREKLNPQLRVVGVLPTMAEPQTLMTQNTLLALKEKVRAIPVFSPVPKSVKFPESNLAGKPIHLYAREWRLLQPYREVVKALTMLDQ